MRLRRIKLRGSFTRRVKPVHPTDVIGLPLPGTDLKLVSIEDRFEMRVKGPTLKPRSGYIGAPLASADLFDADGFFKTGDAVRFADPDKPEMGLVFAGRLSEDFKLASGTYVRVEAMRQGLLAKGQELLQEAVICGLNENYPSALIWIKSGIAPKETPHLVAEVIGSYNRACGGSSTRIGAALILTEPPTFESGEITVKGTIAQRVVRERRIGDIARIYGKQPDHAVIRPENVAHLEAACE